MQSLSIEEKKRYSRHIILPEVGIEGQQKLKSTSVLVVGAGGLGSPVLLYLTAAGIGHIGILDFDQVDESNLQRQILYSTNDVGKSKAKSALTHLTALNPLINFDFFEERLDNHNALDILGNFDIIVDGSDNFQTRYLINDACVILGKPWVFGSIYKFEGQVSVFNYNNGPSYRCLYPTPPLPGEMDNCSEIGVIGVLPGIIGTYQANEVVKMVLGIGQVLSGQLLVFDALNMNQYKVKFQKNSDNFELTQLVDYEVFCGTKKVINLNDSISPKDLAIIIEDNLDFQLIDVRENWEAEICKIHNSQLIPLSQLGSKIELISTTKPVVFYCHHGLRSAQAISFLKSKHNFTNLINLSSGIHGWAMEVDNGMEQY